MKERKETEDVKWLYAFLGGVIGFISSLYVGMIVFEQHNGEPTKESCIEYFENYTK